MSSADGTRFASWVPAGFLAGFTVVLVWALASPSFAPAPASSGAQVAIIAIYAAAFGALGIGLVPRLSAVAAGAFAVLAVGSALRFYSPTDAARYLADKADTLVLLAGVGAVTSGLGASGVFEVIAARILDSAGGRPRTVFLRLCLATFVLSMFVNNLATILVLVPISLRVARDLRIDPIPLILGEVIASNLGGASTMIGDFPNMLLATDVGLPFVAFLVYLAPICVLQLGLMLWYLAPEIPSREQQLGPRSARRIAWDPVAAARGAGILGAMIVGFFACGWWNVSPAVVAAGAGVLALASCRLSVRELPRALHLPDAAFFAFLFVMVGAVSATGALDDIGRRIAALWAESPVLGAVSVAWGAAAITCALNAGPTTALLIHVLGASFAADSANPTVWWALSLGVCAGSSATLTGATAGPIAASLLEQRGFRLSFGRFAATGIPLMLMFLGTTTIYLALLVGAQ